MTNFVVLFNTEDNYNITYQTFVIIARHGYFRVPDIFA